jgi:hypothetical protein
MQRLRALSKHESSAAGVGKLRSLEVEEIRALRQAVELELDYRKTKDAQNATARSVGAHMSLANELNAERITLFRIGPPCEISAQHCSLILDARLQ